MELSPTTVGGPAATIRRVGEALSHQEEALGRVIAERIVGDVPGYRDLGPELRDDLVAGAAATAGALARALRDGVAPRREQLAFVRELAARRVRQGVPLDEFLHAYRTALLVAWDACAEEAARLEVPREAGFALARAAMDAIDVITTHAAEAYVREEARVRAESGRAERDLVERLVSGQVLGEPRREAAAPGLDPTGPLVAVVGRLEHTGVPAGDALPLVRDELQERLALGRVRPLVAIRHAEVVVVASGGSGSTILDVLRAVRAAVLAGHAVDVRFGVGMPALGFAGIAQAYREATLSLSHASSSRPVVSLADLSSLECALVGADAATRAVIASKGAGLDALSADELATAAATVRAFAAADLNVNRAAQALHVHPNTVRHRLGRIAGTTGHDPRTFAGLVDLVCILEAGGVSPPGTPGPGRPAPR